jgi:membrane-associated protein
MPWPTFLFYNALGGIAWATSVGLAAYFIGPAAEHILKVVGLAGVGLAVFVVAAIVWLRRRRS